MRGGEIMRVLRPASSPAQAIKSGNLTKSVPGSLK